MILARKGSSKAALLFGSSNSFTAGSQLVIAQYIHDDGGRAARACETRLR